MATSHRDDAPSHTPREIYHLLYFLQALRADIELRAGVEGAGPCVVDVRLRGSERHIGICAIELDGKAWRHHDAGWRRMRHPRGVEESGRRWGCMGCDGGVFGICRDRGPEDVSATPPCRHRADEDLISSTLSWRHLRDYTSSSTAQPGHVQSHVDMIMLICLNCLSAASQRVPNIPSSIQRRQQYASRIYCRQRSLKIPSVVFQAQY